MKYLNVSEMRLARGGEGAFRAVATTNNESANQKLFCIIRDSSDSDSSPNPQNLDNFLFKREKVN